MNGRAINSQPPAWVVFNLCYASPEGYARTQRMVNTQMNNWKNLKKSTDGAFLIFISVHQGE